MDVFEAIRTRRSIRSYSDRPVEEAKLQQVLEAGRLAPSASNRQDWVFVVVRDAAKRQKLVAACKDQKFIGQAPVVLVVCATNMEYRMRSGLAIAAVDPTIAVDHMTLAATALGLGTCWIGAFEPEKVAAVVDVPAGATPVHVLPLGYPAESPEPRARKAMSEVVVMQ